MATFRLSIPKYVCMCAIIFLQLLTLVRESDCQGVPPGLHILCNSCKTNCSYCKTLAQTYHKKVFINKVLRYLKIKNDTHLLNGQPTESPYKVIKIQSQPSDYVYNNKVMQFRIGNISQVDKIKQFDLYLYFDHKGKKKRMIRLLISAVNERGKEKKKLASLEFKVKTGWKHMSLPINKLRKMLRKGNGAIYLFLKCQKCNRRTRVILPFEQKKKKKRRMRRKRIRRLLRMLKINQQNLNENRPIMKVKLDNKGK